MKTAVFSPARAVTLNAWGLVLVLVLLLATPLRSSVVIALLMLYAIAFLIVNRRQLVFQRFDAIVVLLLCALLIGRVGPFIVGEFRGRYLSDGLHMAASVPIYVMLRQLAGRKDCYRLADFLEWGIIFGALGGAVIALYQTQWLGMPRADGFLFSINFGYLNAIVMALALALMSDSRRSLLLGVAAAAALLALLLSGTRGAMLVVPFILALISVLQWWRFGHARFFIGTGIVLLAMLVAYQALPAVEKRVDDGVSQIASLLAGDPAARHSSAGLRVELWKASWEAVKERPLVGLSYPEREDLNKQLVASGEVVPWVGGVSRGHAHSLYFEMLATGGIIGILALMGYLVVPAVYYLRTVMRDPTNRYALAGLSMTMAVAVCGLTEVLLQQEMIAAFYAYMQAVLVSMARFHHSPGEFQGHISS